MEFQQTAVAEGRELDAYRAWRDKYAAEADRCRRYEPVRRSKPTKLVSGWFDARMIVEALAPLPRGSRVLDLPCGGGRLSRALGAAGYRPFAADYSRFMLREAVGGACGRIRADALRLPFDAHAFDASVCFRFMQSVPWELRIQALRELGRVSGTVVAGYASVYSLRSIRRFAQGRAVPRNRTTERQVRAEVEAAGLEAVGFHYKARLFYEDFVVVARRP